MLRRCPASLYFCVYYSVVLSDENQILNKFLFQFNIFYTDGVSVQSYYAVILCKMFALKTQLVNIVLIICFNVLFSIVKYTTYELILVYES